MKSINRRSLLYFALAVAAALALYGLSARLAAESGGKTAAFVTDSREIFSLAYQSGKTPADVWREVNALGVAGAAVSEFTGDELAMYSSLGVRFGPAAVFTAKLNADAARAVLCWRQASERRLRRGERQRLRASAGNGGGVQVFGARPRFLGARILPCQRRGRALSSRPLHAVLRRGRRRGPRLAHQRISSD